jgi:hypothetical protein
MCWFPDMHDFYFVPAEGKRHLLRFNQLLGDTLLTPSRLPGDYRF